MPSESKKLYKNKLTAISKSASAKGQSSLKNGFEPENEEPDENEGQEEAGGQTPQGQAESINDFGQLSLPSFQSNIHVITIVGQVEGHLEMPPQNKATKYEHIIPQLVAVEQNPHIEGLLIILNTVGGDVEAGLAIAEMIASLSKPTVSLVLGGGHSIGVPIAVSAKTSFIAPTASMTIHPVRLTGLVVGVQQSFDYLERMQDRVIQFITTHSQVDEEKFRAMMMTTGELARDVGTIVVGENAVSCGLIDCLGGLDVAMQNLNEQIQGYKAANPQPEASEAGPQNHNFKHVDNFSKVSARHPKKTEVRGLYKHSYRKRPVAAVSAKDQAFARAPVPEMEEGHGLLCTDVPDDNWHV